MLNSVFMIGSLCYGIVVSFHLLKKSTISDAILMLVLCCMIAGYFTPQIGEKWPTVESLYNKLYTPISEYVSQQLLNKKTGGI
jgi:hypothetical protein